MQQQDCFQIKKETMMARFSKKFFFIALGYPLLATVLSLIWNIIIAYFIGIALIAIGILTYTLIVEHTYPDLL